MIAKIRGFDKADFPFLFELLNGPDGEQRLLYMHYADGDILSWLQQRGIKVMIAEDDGRKVGSVAYNDGFWGEEIEWLVVSRIAGQKLVEDMLVAEAEKCVKRGTVFVSVEAGSPKIEEWTRRGYCPNGGLYYMIAGIAELKTIPRVPDGVVLRSLKGEEENEFVQLVNAGFEFKRVKLGDIQKWKTEYPPFDEEWVHVAEINGKLVSVVVAKPDRGYNQFFSAKRGYLGPAATLREHRGKNLASALTVRAMNSLFEQGMDSACLFTLETNASSINLLRKIGFEVGCNWKFMLKRL